MKNTILSKLVAKQDGVYKNYVFQNLDLPYESLFKYCRQFGVKLYNATEGGLLDCLPQVKLADIMQGRALK